MKRARGAEDAPAAASNEDVHPENKGFFDKVKELFG